VLEHDRVLTRDVATACAAVAHVVPDPPLQLEGDVLDDVRRVRPAAEPGDEAAALADAAAMLDQAGQRRDERAGHAGHVSR
jgi:hypothetical protein